MAGVTLPSELSEKLNREFSAGNPVDLIIEYDDTEIETVTRTMRRRLVKRRDNDEIRAYKVNQYQALKDSVDLPTRRPEIEDLQSYSHLPMGFKRFKSRDALETFAAHPRVKAVHLNEKMHLASSQNLPLINQPLAAKVGKQGAGTTVVVIDNGIDYNKAAFGSCSSPSNPTATCRVSVAQNFISSSRFRQAATNHDHGTNIAGTVLEVAPASKIVALNVFDATGNAYDNDVLAAINWSIANQGSYHIVAINLSLGGPDKFTSPCRDDWSSSTITQAKNAGISVVVAAGNAGYHDGLSSPACAPDALSVGAVYDSNMGGVNWGACTDSVTGPDQVACFSNTANFLSILAPGVDITAAEVNSSGTSQSAPHVAGAIAVLSAAFPSESLIQLQNRLSNLRVPRVTDPRNNLSFPRLDLLQALANLPANNNFADASSLSSSLSGSVSSLSLLSTKETGEPQHAAIPGGQSVWWKWTAPASGQLSLDTHDSNYDTLLAVYTGTAINALSSIAANNNDGFGLGNSSVLLQAQAGQEYKIAIDGVNGAGGFVQLNWSLDTSANANLSVGISGPNTISLGTQQPYVITVTNDGPKIATNVAVATNLPSGATFVSSTAQCSATGNIVNCLIGNMQANSSASLTMQIRWDSLGANTQLSVGVSSDLPDNAQVNNTTSLQLAQSASTDTGDTPTLPEWGLILMSALMMAIGRQAQLSAKTEARSMNKRS